MELERKGEMERLKGEGKVCEERKRKEEEQRRGKGKEK